ncbi:hypothetical protein L6452_41036 [Arctium lappa]|uniref:Uncharacterized protein n=1 Tax=Arctium lappa TaxID=4217 RepID=A0ACB8XSF6_ARCLA|nr:hypothetical protein L6452_41036 [Arctium lappa]
MVWVRQRWCIFLRASPGKTTGDGVGSPEMGAQRQKAISMEGSLEGSASTGGHCSSPVTILSASFPISILSVDIPVTCTSSGAPHRCSSSFSSLLLIYGDLHLVRCSSDDLHLVSRCTHLVSRYTHLVAVHILISSISSC